MPRVRQRSARTSDKHILYQEAVQSPDGDAAFIERLYKRKRGKSARSFKEDFCGTHVLSCEWIKRHRDNTAVGVDLHQPTLCWGITNNQVTLSNEQRTRMTLIMGDVLEVTRPKVDVVAAMNFSYFIFKDRTTLRRYFQKAYASLNKDGMFLLDAYGGSDAHLETEDRRKCDGFTYVWDQSQYNPITNETLCHIHFEFKDGSRLRRAFSYDWRLWTLMEIKELLHEVGFKHTEVHWEGTDTKTGEGNGIFRVSSRGEATASWIAYIVALK